MAEVVEELRWYKAKVSAAEYALSWEFLEAPRAVQEYQEDVSALVAEVERLRGIEEAARQYLDVLPNKPMAALPLMVALDSRPNGRNQ